MKKEKEIFTLLEIKEKLESLKDDSAKKDLLRKFFSDDDYKNIKRDLVKDYVPLILKKPSRTFELVYDSFSEGLEPIYYWILDFMRDSGPGGLGLDVFKGPEEYEASVSSGYFGEIGQRASLMQQKAMEYLGAINQLIKSILNIIYDLKEFETRLEYYDGVKSEDAETRKGSSFALKGIWMDTVDIKKGKGSINMLAQDLGFVTIRDAFFYIDDAKKIKDLDLNERVRRILTQKFKEYETWRELSEREIRKRYNVERAYLKSQIGTLKLYSSWAKPYLRAAQKLQMKEFNMPDIVNNFSNIEIQLSLLGKKEVIAEDVHESYKDAEIPYKHYAVLAIEMDFRGVPSAVQTQQGGRQYVHGGRASIKFKAYALDEVELAAVESRELYEDMDLVDEWVSVSLEELQVEVDQYLQNPKHEGKKPKPTMFENPFKGTLEGFKGIVSPLTDAVQFFVKPVKSTDIIEADLKKHTAELAGTLLFVLYNIYKKAHGMLSV